jgi:hypothetical protein
MEQENRNPPYNQQRAIRTRYPEKQILGMDKSNDPFYSGQPWQRQDAAWFAEFHRRRVGSRRLQIRALFYIATGEDPSPVSGAVEATNLPDGSRFEKTADNWKMFQEAAKFARNMGLVIPRLILDKKRSRVTVNARPIFDAAPPSVEYTPPYIGLPDSEDLHSYVQSASASVPWMMSSYMRRNQPSVIEVWTEKDLDEADRPILEEVCADEGANLVVGTGAFTISSAYGLLERTEEYGLPVRVLFLSDFDDAGAHMPVSPARHIEFAIRDLDPKPDIALYHLALTAEQVEEQSIPRKIPTSKKDEQKTGRLKNFEKRPGIGTVELNTLTDPSRADYFERLLRDAIAALRDPDLYRRAREAREQSETRVAEEFEKQMRWPHRALDLIAEQADEKSATFEEERAEIQRLEDKLAR